jgi:hypothetical protein
MKELTAGTDVAFGIILDCTAPIDTVCREILEKSPDGLGDLLVTEARDMITRSSAPSGAIARILVVHPEITLMGSLYKLQDAAKAMRAMMQEVMDKVGKPVGFPVKAFGSEEFVSTIRSALKQEANPNVDDLSDEQVMGDASPSHGIAGGMGGCVRMGKKQIEGVACTSGARARKACRQEAQTLHLDGVRQS